MECAEEDDYGNAALPDDMSCAVLSPTSVFCVPHSQSRSTCSHRKCADTFARLILACGQKVTGQTLQNLEDKTPWIMHGTTSDLLVNTTHHS
ncbi:hypothetical protein GLOTRDRAFT_133954 [Gloeophyllum trabeum ATCC 11539]|uniref:Uncharacterized protein n=1 Tax=Gloeophyllum trabeum (strain ATCC 11539 / FP-39264 / Madison 617) TaxID=670483 RepID=S7PRB6_GLOTA|nr:uncharacterized protein GLOTRDRAFT_133954 [Gloeophyllum trabeum ATCC 11539]EPQ50401.1 hypothetical protein GLOTRDRAFT_133954 [Gloeophyllum trabeum ATCC 11539]